MWARPAAGGIGRVGGERPAGARGRAVRPSRRSSLPCEHQKGAARFQPATASAAGWPTRRAATGGELAAAFRREARSGSRHVRTPSLPDPTREDSPRRRAETRRPLGWCRKPSRRRARGMGSGGGAECATKACELQNTRATSPHSAASRSASHQSAPKWHESRSAPTLTPCLPRGGRDKRERELERGGAKLSLASTRTTARRVTDVDDKRSSAARRGRRLGPCAARRSSPAAGRGRATRTRRARPR